MHAAFFDMDHTVLAVNSGTEWMRFLRRRGEITRLGMVRALSWAIRYRLGVLDLPTLARRLVEPLRGQAEDAMRDLCHAWVEDEIRATIVRRGLEVLATHRAAGERCVLLTSSTPYVAIPVARALGIDDVLCSRLEVEAGRFTGRLVEPICYGEGKVSLAETWARDQGIALEGSTFYTDSVADLPMLERVGRPVAVDPDPRLARIAARRRWPIERWARHGTVGAKR